MLELALSRQIPKGPDGRNIQPPSHCILYPGLCHSLFIICLLSGVHLRSVVGILTRLGHEAGLRPVNVYGNSSPLPSYLSSSRPPSLNKHSAFSLMSRSQPTASGSSTSNFQLIINKALETYQKRTKKNLLDHPLASQLQACDSPGDILAILHQQIQGLDQSRGDDERWTRWLDPTIHVLFTFSQTVGTVGLV